MKIKLLDKNENSAIILAGILSLIVGVGISRFVFTSLLPFMLKDYLSVTLTGLLASSNYFAYFAGSILAIFIQDIHLKIKFFRFGLFLCLVATFVLGLSHNEFFWFGSRVLAGFGSAMALVVGSSLVMTKLNMKNKTKAMGIHFSGIGFSIFLPDILVKITNKLGFTWEQTWIILAFFGVILSIYCIYILSFEKKKEEELNNQTSKFSFDKSIFSFFVFVLIFAYFTEGIAMVVQATFLPDIINNIKGLVGFGALTWNLAGFAGIFTCIIWLRLAHKFGSINIIILAMLFQTVGILIPTLSSNLYLNVLGGLLYGGTFVGLVGLFLNLGGQIARKNPLVLMGALTSAYGIGQVSAPLYSVILIKHFHSYDEALILTTFILGIGILSLLFAKIKFGKKYKSF